MKEVSLNFGAIRDSIYNFSTKELMKEGVNESQIIKRFLKEIKNEPVLKMQYLIFKNLEKGNFKKEALAERYINQNLKLLESIHWHKILETNKKLRQELLREYHVDGETKEKNFLYENIQILIESTTRNNFSNIDLFNEAFENVLSSLLKEKTTEEPKETEEMPKFFSWKFINELAVSNFNERYAHLNEEERKLLKMLFSPYENKLKYSETLKEEVLKSTNLILESGINKEVKETINMFKEKINSLPVINESNIDEIIINCTELLEELKEVN
jgi:hypothetical protein